MTCQQAKPLIDLYADGELEAASIQEVEQHIQGCSSCALAWRNLQSLKKTLKQDALYFTAPAGLRQRIQAELPSPEKAVPQRLAWRWNWLTTAMSGAFAVCLAVLLAVTQSSPSSEQLIAQEIVSSHVRSLMADHIMDVVSTDQHTVKPWFNGKLDFSPPVKDLAAQEFPLVGGRLDYIGGHSVAALVFKRHKHIINLFIWPVQDPASTAIPIAPNQGYHVIHWTDAGMTFWTVSDLNEKELMEFVQDFNSAALLKEH